MVAVYPSYPRLKDILYMENTANYKIPKKVGRKGLQEVFADILNVLNKVFEFETEQHHIDDNKYLLSKSESHQRIIFILRITASILIMLCTVLLYGISNLQTKTKMIEPNASSMAVQNLYIIYTNGYTLNMGAHYIRPYD